MKYLFGPVNSRRLGTSLGIDLLSAKICTLNCIYCECGSTRDLTVELKEYVPAGEVIDEIDKFLINGPVLDVITFSGAGEPTLHSGIGGIINHIKKNYPSYKVAVLTNGTLLWNEKVRDALKNADLVIPSLDAVMEDTFKIISRPHREISPERVMEGLIRFGKEYKGEIILEVFIIPGINTSLEDLQAIKKACSMIRHNEIDLNTLDRPGAVKWVRPAEMELMKEIAEFFSPMKVKIIGKPGPSDKKTLDNESAGSIIDIIKRRPSTIDELKRITGHSVNELNTILDELLEKKIIMKEELQRGVFFRVI